MRRKPKLLFLSIFLLFIFTTCGIDELFFLPPVTHISVSGGTDIIITLPNISTITYYYATNFTIYYRIYLSDVSVDGSILETQYSTLNPQLETDFNDFNRTFINPTNVQVPTVSSFTNRSYYRLRTNNASVLSLIPPASTPRDIQINFTAGESATITDLYASATPIALLRNNSISPIPDYYFQYSSELATYGDNTGPSKTYNNDVINNVTASGLKSYECAYVSMYIVTEGIQNNFQALYSRPKHIGVFRLL